MLWRLAPEIQTGHHILSGFILVGIEDLVHNISISAFKVISRMLATTYFSCRGMQHANVLPRHDVDQFTRFDILISMKLGSNARMYG